MKKIAYDLKWRFYAEIPNAVNAIRAGNLLFLSGCSSLDPNGKVVGPGNIELQTRQAMENMKAALEAAGASFENVVHMDTFYASSLDRETILRSVKVRSSYFSRENPYTTTGVAIAGFTVPGLLIEIDGIAVLS
jgi:enamine deaminase RidA (YjgF/YER057c/UK114 family)